MAGQQLLCQWVRLAGNDNKERTKSVKKASMEGTFTLQVSLEYVDKSATFEKEKCEPDADYREDDCLYQCLMDKYARKFGCVHSR